MKQNILLKTLCIIGCLCSINYRNTVQCMEAPLPATPKYDEDNLQKPLSNEEKNNNKINEKNSNEENNIKINFDKEKVAKLRESFGKEIESLAKTYSNFMTKFEATFGAMQEIGSNYINHQ